MCGKKGIYDRSTGSFTVACIVLPAGNLIEIYRMHSDFLVQGLHV